MKTLITGAGIAGPALGYWLAQAGHDVTIVERAPALRVGGYAVDIRGVALEVVARMGLRERLRPLETDTLSNDVVDARGRRFGRTARGFGVIDRGDVEIGRGDLARVLVDATRAAVAYRFDDGPAALAQDAGGVDVTFVSGRRARYDLVVGADGVHSATRALAFGPEADFVRPLGSIMGIFSVPNELGLVREQLLFNALGRVASVKCAEGDRALKVCVFFAAAPDVIAAFDARDVAAQRRLVAAAFGDAGWEFARLVERMAVADDFYCDLTCQVRMPSCVAGRDARVGDAAHCPSPLSGQGTSLALVGACVLGAELAAIDTGPDAVAAGSDAIASALARYDAAMRPFVALNQAVALEIGQGFAPSTPRQLWLRNLAMRMLPYMPRRGVVKKLALRGVRRAARALELPPPRPA
ncbi:MAG: FAD-dependent monooxygenase [Myxococcota bacterium]